VGKAGVGPWQRREISAFLREFVELGTPVIPVLLANSPAQPQLPILLKNMTYVDFRRQESSPFESLLWGITGRRSASPLPQGLPVSSASQSFREDLGKGVTLDMVKIPGGTFLMGSPKSEEGHRDSESPQHSVTIAPFYMGKFAVTQAQYQAVMGDNPANFKGDQRPVERVSWHDAIAFCQKLSEKTGNHYRLPSEAEWEYACRAGTTTPFYFGETITSDLVNFNGGFTYGAASKGICRGTTTEVGSFPPNEFGLYDMHGNVWEWCADRWHGNYKGAPIDGNAWMDGDSNYRLLRGGSWYFNPADCRSAIRNFDSPDSRDLNLGFRVVCSSART
jgi:formylglycine-generating enzyme required for sulfatase activity